MDYNFKTLSGNTKFLSYKDWQIGDYVIGDVQYLKPNSKNPNNQDVIVKILETNIKHPIAKLQVGDLFTINGTTALEKAIQAGIGEEDIVKVVYLGKEEVKTGPWKGTKANKLEVSVAPAQDKSKVVFNSNDDLI